MTRARKLRVWLRERGVLWTLLYGIRWAGRRTVHLIEQRLIALEKRRLLTGDDTVSSSYHSSVENRAIWDSYDWSQGGEEWTAAVAGYRGLAPDEWKASLVDGVMRKYITGGSTVLEIGPGGGRWTEALRTMAGRLILADISRHCLDTCRKRFEGDRRIEYHLITGGAFPFLEDDSIDRAWSYDVFVHINPSDTERYVHELRRVLKPGGVAVIHHSGTYATEREAAESFRSHVTERLFAHFVKGAGLRIMEQDRTSVHKPGDCITVVAKP